MKKLIPFIFVVLFFAFLYGCSENTVTQNVTKKSLTYSTIRVPDTLSVKFEAIDSVFTTSDSAVGLQFSAAPKIRYEIKAESGFGSFTLKNNLDSIIFYKMFGGYVSDTVSLQDVPIKYVFSTSSFIGKGSIKVTK